MAVYDEQELQRLLALPEEDLYADLFAHSEAGQGVLGSPGMRQQRGRKLFEAHRAKFRTVVCDEWQGCDKIERADDMISLLQILAAMIAPVAPHIPAATAAVLIAKIGISVFCECSRQERE